MQDAFLNVHAPRAIDILVRLMNSDDEKNQIKGVELLLGWAPYFTPKMTHQMNEAITPTEIVVINKSDDYELDGDGEVISADGTWNDNGIR